MVRCALMVAAAENGVIGVNNKLPWHLPEDLKYFRKVTMSKPIIMGRATFDSIGRPLPGRKNIVVTRNAEWNFPGVTVVNDLESAHRIAAAQAEIDGVEEYVVIGGANIYAQAMAKTTRIYFTEVKANVFGDARFEMPDLTDWNELDRQDFDASETNPYPYSFVTYDRHR